MHRIDDRRTASEATRWESSSIRPLALTGVLVLFGTSVAPAGQFVYDPISPGDIVSATFSADFAALVAHRTIAGREVNYARLHDLSAGLPTLDLSDDLFGTAAWPAPAELNMGAVETGWVSASIAPSFFPALEGGRVALEFLFTDTDDALFAIDALILTIETQTRTIESLFGWPIGDENNGFGLGIPDGGALPAPFPGVLNPTGTGFDEELSSTHKVPAEPTSLLLLGLGVLAVHRRRVRRLAVPALVLLACSWVAAPVAAEDVQPGIDVFATPPEGAWTGEFCAACPACPACAGTPLPTGFFGLGSDPFDDVIVLQGDPFPGHGFGTIVERLEAAPLSGCPAEATIQIEIVALSLVSSEPITITHNGGQDPEEWDVEVCLSDLAQPAGSMTIRQDCPAGGTYDSTLPVLAKFTFTPVGGGPPLVFDAGLRGLPPLVLLATGAAWTNQAPPEMAVAPIPPGLQVDGNCDGVDDDPLPGTSNFVAGIDAGLCVCGGGAPDPCRRIELSDEEAENNNGAHNVQPPGFDEVSCCMPDASCRPFTGEEGVKQCEDAGGVPLGGEGASCDVTGACCLPNGTCVPNSTRCCCEDWSSGQYMGDGTTECPVPPCQYQLYIIGPIPNKIPLLPADEQAGDDGFRDTGTIDAVVQAAGFIGLPDREVVFTKVSGLPLTGTYTFTSGTVSPDGTQAAVTTDQDGTAQMTFSADGLGPGLIEATVAGTGLSAFSFFEIVAAAAQSRLRATDHRLKPGARSLKPGSRRDRQ